MTEPKTKPKADARCPECRALRLVNWRYNHSDDCGIGAVEQRTRRADLTWFSRGKDRAERPSTRAEIALVRAAGLEVPDDARTLTRRSGSPERIIGGHGPKDEAR